MCWGVCCGAWPGGWDADPEPPRCGGAGVSAAIAAAAGDARAVRGEGTAGDLLPAAGRGLASSPLFIISALPCAVTGSAPAE